MQDTSQSWLPVVLKLKALMEQQGPPTFFQTVSGVDNYWAELHNLMSKFYDSSNTHCAKAVIDHRHITGCFFHQN